MTRIVSGPHYERRQAPPERRPASPTVEIKDTGVVITDIFFATVLGTLFRAGLIKFWAYLEWFSFIGFSNDVSWRQAILLAFMAMALSGPHVERFKIVRPKD